MAEPPKNGTMQSHVSVRKISFGSPWFCIMWSYCTITIYGHVFLITEFKTSPFWYILISLNMVFKWVKIAKQVDIIVNYFNYLHSISVVTDVVGPTVHKRHNIQQSGVSSSRVSRESSMASIRTVSSSTSSTDKESLTIYENQSDQNTPISDTTENSSQSIKCLLNGVPTFHIEFMW